MGPLVAPTGTVAVIWVGASMLNVAALMPLNETAVAPSKSVPVITTVLPMGPLAGVKPAIEGDQNGLRRTTVCVIGGDSGEMFNWAKTVNCAASEISELAASETT